MLLKFYHQSYEELVIKLLELQKLVIAEDTDMIAITTVYEQIQTMFQEQILTVRLDELDCSAISLLRSAQTEIYKNLRLLGTELLFLRSARQGKTTKERLEKVQGKVEELIGYCRAIISHQAQD
ncbi:heterocyst frequency control protein PatD [Crocosphaera sp.]|uniref:heterocyst frequency control protein PatD n=1 Tax=Crocosphaera sp. TaxID=2729996 RepID=UPI003F28144D|nr:heterocyst frequency control protein PatD [Crocosphaera sp.]